MYIIFTKEKFQIGINVLLAILSIILSITFVIIALGFIDIEISKGLAFFHILAAPIIVLLSTINYIIFKKNTNTINKVTNLFKITYILALTPLAMELFAFSICGA